VTFALYNINRWVLCHEGGESLLCFVNCVFMLHTHFIFKGLKLKFGIGFAS